MPISLLRIEFAFTVRINLIIRPLNPDKIQALLEIEQQSHFLPWGEQSFNACFTEKQYLHWGAFSTDNPEKLLGYLIFMEILPEIELLNITIDPQYRRQGIAQKLLHTAFSFFAQAKQVNRCFLEVRQSNLAAQQLYLQQGFVFSGKRPRYYQTLTGKEDALLMEKIMSL